MSTVSASEWRVIGITSLGHALCHTSELAFAAVVLSVMAEFDLSPERGLALAVPGFVLYGVGAVPAGVWTDRRGSREVLTIYFVLVAISSLAIMLARSVWQLGGALTALGAAISLYHPAGLAMISHGCRRRGHAMGINGVAGSVGVSLGPTLGLLFAWLGYWRAVYGVIAVLGLLAAVVTLRLHLPRERHLDGDPPRDLTTASAKTPSVSPALRSKLMVMSILFLAMLLGGLNYRCLTTALPPYLGNGGQWRSSAAEAAPPSQVAESPSAIGSLFVFVTLACGGVGQLLGGHLADRHSPPVCYAAMIAMTAPLAVAMAHFGMPLAVGFACVLAVFMFAQQPLENIMIADATPAAWRSTVYGIKFILAFGIASSGAYLTGWVWQRYALVAVFYVFALIAVVMASVASLYAWLAHASRKGAWSTLESRPT